MKHSQTNENRLLTSKQSAGYLAISERKLWDMSKSGEIPAVRLGRAKRYDRQDLDLFIQRAKGEGIANVQ